MSMPNWKKEEDYAFIETLDAHGWAWEFLRRNKDYQAAFLECIELVKVNEQLHGPYPKPIFHEKEYPHKLFYSPARHENESARNWSQRNASIKGVNPEVLHPKAYYARKWGLIGLENPINDAACPKFIPVRQLPSVLDSHGLSRLLQEHENIENHIRLVSIDLTLPLSAQMKAVKNNLQELQEEFLNKKKPKGLPPLEPKNWLLYLRAWDAKQSGSSLKEIGERLIPHLDSKESDYLPSKKAKTWIESAEKYIQKDYRYCVSVKKLK